MTTALRRLAALSAMLLALVGPGRAQPAPVPEDVVMAVPAVALTFSAGYLGEDLGLFEKHGVRVKSVVIAGIGSTNAVISGSADFAQISAATLTLPPRADSACSPSLTRSTA